MNEVKRIQKKEETKLKENEIKQVWQIRCRYSCGKKEEIRQVATNIKIHNEIDKGKSVK